MQIESPVASHMVMNEFASLIHLRGSATRYSTYISSSLGRCVKSEFSTHSSLDEIKNILERDDILLVLEKKNLLEKYKKAKNFILGNHIKLVDLKKRKPKKDEIWQFRIDKQFRAYCYFKSNTLIVFHIDNHQN